MKTQAHITHAGRAPEYRIGEATEPHVHPSDQGVRSGKQMR
jgi:hypothetical protein